MRIDYIDKLKGFAIPIIGLCVALTLCIRRSNFLNMLLFGFKKKNII